MSNTAGIKTIHETKLEALLALAGHASHRGVAALLFAVKGRSTPQDATAAKGSGGRRHSPS